MISYVMSHMIEETIEDTNGLPGLVDSDDKGDEEDEDEEDEEDSIEEDDDDDEDANDDDSWNDRAQASAHEAQHPSV